MLLREDGPGDQTNVKQTKIKFALNYHNRLGPIHFLKNKKAIYIYRVSQKKVGLVFRGHFMP